ncbi:MAG TPA: hypothetical protein VL173_05580 [Vicinamibacterales bacterium]|nr:hypothetical protein [Vicinamibacterales bacterium]
MAAAMKIAWFHRDPVMPAIDASDAADVASALTDEHHIDRVTAARAHDFVWQHARQPYDLTIFELGDTPADAFMWPYVFHYPGVLALNARTLERARSATLVKHQRTHHLRAERALGWNLLRAPLLASRLVVVRDAAAADELREAHPGIEVRTVPIGVRPLAIQPPAESLRFVITGNRQDVAARAAARARAAGLPIVLTTGADPLPAGDTVVALEWPATGAAPVAALRAMASGLTAIVFETEATAVWPTLDPQNWQPRGYRTEAAPIAVSIDPRDEEHSLMLAMKRLSADAGLRTDLATAARAWAWQHASVRAAAEAWKAVIDDAVRRPPPAAPADLPPHLTADGTSRARTLLAGMGVEVDLSGLGIPAGGDAWSPARTNTRARSTGAPTTPSQ